MKLKGLNVWHYAPIKQQSQPENPMPPHDCHHQQTEGTSPTAIWVKLCTIFFLVMIQCIVYERTVSFSMGGSWVFFVWS